VPDSLAVEGGAEGASSGAWANMLIDSRTNRRVENSKRLMVRIHLRLRQRASRGPESDRNSRQVEAVLVQIPCADIGGTRELVPVSHNQGTFLRSCSSID
jgi:hypothetical protein